MHLHNYCLLQRMLLTGQIVYHNIAGNFGEHVLIIIISNLVGNFQKFTKINPRVKTSPTFPAIQYVKQ